MSSTYLDLCAKARREFGISGSGPTSVLNQTSMFQKLVEWIADADEYIQSRWFDWGFLLTQFSTSTSSGLKDISAPADLGLWDTNSFYLNYTSDSYKHLELYDYFEWRNGLRLGTQTNEEPDYVIIKPDHSLILHPPPDATYTLTADYYKTPTRMTANTSTSLIPARFERIIIAQAKIYWATHDDAQNELQMAVAERDDLLRKLESAYLPEQSARATSANDGLMVVPE